MSQLTIDFPKELPKIDIVQSTIQKELNFVTVANHPCGGYTLAVPLNQEIGSGRIYHQWFSLKSCADETCAHHNRDLCKRYKNNPQFRVSIEHYLATRKMLGDLD